MTNYIYVASAIDSSMKPHYQVLQSNALWVDSGLMEIRKKPFHPLAHITKTGRTPAKIYKMDVKAIKGASGMIALLQTPSTGLGIELGLAAQLDIPVLGLDSEIGQTSPFVIGYFAANGWPIANCRWYGDATCAIKDWNERYLTKEER